MTRHPRVKGWRRIAGAMWSAPDDPQIFGALELDAEPMLAFMQQARASGHRVTPTHLVGRAVAHSLACVPDLNVQIRGDRVVPRESVDVFFVTAVAGGQDLSGVKVIGIDDKSAIEVAEELTSRAAAIKSGNDRDFARTKQLMDAMPHWLLRAALRTSALLTERLGVEVSSLGLQRAPFGSAMVTSVGMLGLPQGFAPLAWMYDVPLLVLVGEITSRAVVIEGKVEAREVLPITATIDHRYADGWHISRLLEAFREYVAAPAKYEPVLPIVQVVHGAA